MSKDIDTNGWPEYRKYVVEELKDLKAEVHEIRHEDTPALRKEIACLRLELRTHKVRVTTWAASIVTVVTIAVNAVIALFKG